MMRLPLKMLQCRAGTARHGCGWRAVPALRNFSCVADHMRTRDDGNVQRNWKKGLRAAVVILSTILATAGVPGSGATTRPAPNAASPTASVSNPQAERQ